MCKQVLNMPSSYMTVKIAKWLHVFLNFLFFIGTHIKNEKEIMARADHLGF